MSRWYKFRTDIINRDAISSVSVDTDGAGRRVIRFTVIGNGFYAMSEDEAEAMLPDIGLGLRNGELVILAEEGPKKKAERGG
jgi:hypothetical protein